MFRRKELFNFATMKECRMLVKSVISDLYPEEKFSRRMFPELYDLLQDLFWKDEKVTQIIEEKSRGYMNELEFRITAKEILDFKNLLMVHPRTVVLIYRKYIEKFIYYKHRKVEERDDLVQEVITRLMEDKIFKIRNHFDFNKQKVSSFTSYLMVTVRNIYIDIIRERSIRPLTAGELQPVEDVPDGSERENMLNRMVVDEELDKLRTIIKLFHKTRPKLELCLKLKFRVPVSPEDTSRCFPGCTREDVQTLTQDFKLEKDKTMFERIITVFNVHEKKNSKSDTLRKWTFVKIDEIVSLLNRTHGRDLYSRDSVGELITLYYHRCGGSIPTSRRLN